MLQLDTVESDRLERLPKHPVLEIEPFLVYMATAMPKCCPLHLNLEEEEMRQVTMKRNDVKRLDAMIALPLARFRRALSELTPEELAALEARIAVQSVKNRWARGGHGLARHRSLHDLGLLARRQEEIRRERQARRGAPAQLHLVESAPNVRDLTSADQEERAA
jgi:hypothetical protein